MNSTDTLNLDFTNSGVKQTIYITQYDSGRTITCNISGIAGEIEHATVYCKKPSGNETYTSATVISNGEVSFDIDPQMVTETGTTYAQLQLFGGGKLLTSTEFNLNVSQNLVATSAMESTSEYPELLETLTRLSSYEFIEITDEEIDALADILPGSGGSGGDTEDSGMNVTYDEEEQAIVFS